MDISLHEKDSSDKNIITDRTVFLMPFTPKSILVYHLLCNNGVKISGFCDNDNNLLSKSFDDIPIFSPTEAFHRDSDAMVILSEILFYDSNSEQLKKLGFNDILKIDDLSFDENLDDFVSKLHEDSYSILIPKQAFSGRYLMQRMSALKSWGLLINELDEEYIRPYYFKEKGILEFPQDCCGPDFLVCVNATSYLDKGFFTKCLDSLSAQKHSRFTSLFVFTPRNKDVVEQELKRRGMNNAACLSVQGLMRNIETIDFARGYFADYKKHGLIITIGANDEFPSNTLAVFANKVNTCKSSAAFTANEDRVYNNEYISPYYKRDYQELKLLDTEGLVRNLVCVRTEFDACISTLKAEDICAIDEILYHYRILNDIAYDNKIKPIAYYLPQFHAIPENDKWWGKGFTEWTNVKRALPMFDGHYQPHVPGDLGHYDLIEEKDIQKKQMDLARKYGIYGFCYYYYWFNGKRLLEKPLDNVINNPELDMPFCICWANENWTRRWDGLESEILMEQKYNDESDKMFIMDVLPILKDPRYITVNGAPILLIYRYDLFPDFKKTIMAWREIAAQNGVPHIHVSVVRTVPYSYDEFCDFGCDSETEFPPWRVRINTITRNLNGLTPDFFGNVYDYKDYVYQSMNVHRKKQLCFRGSMLGFDNTPRRMENATIYYSNDPEEYKKLMLSFADFTSRQPPEERLIFINAWNEWAESNHLEPDIKYGESYLKATHDAISINC